MDSLKQTKTEIVYHPAPLSDTWQQKNSVSMHVCLDSDASAAAAGAANDSYLLGDCAFVVYLVVISISSRCFGEATLPRGRRRQHACTTVHGRVQNGKSLSSAVNCDRAKITLLEDAIDEEKKLLQRYRATLRVRRIGLLERLKCISDFYSF